MLSRAKVKAWGNSLGVIIPKEIANQMGLREGQEVEISVRRPAEIKRLFGKYRLGEGQKVKDEMRAGWHDIDKAKH